MTGACAVRVRDRLSLPLTHRCLVTPRFHLCFRMKLSAATGLATWRAGRVAVGSARGACRLRGPRSRRGGYQCHPLPAAMSAAGDGLALRPPMPGTGATASWPRVTAGTGEQIDSPVGCDGGHSCGTCAVSPAHPHWACPTLVAGPRPLSVPCPASAPCCPSSPWYHSCRSCFCPRVTTVLSVTGKTGLLQALSPPTVARPPKRSDGLARGRHVMFMLNAGPPPPPMHGCPLRRTDVPAAGGSFSFSSNPCPQPPDGPVSAWPAARGSVVGSRGLQSRLVRAEPRALPAVAGALVLGGGLGGTLQHRRAHLPFSSKATEHKVSTRQTVPQAGDGASFSVAAGSPLVGVTATTSQRLSLSFLQAGEAVCPHSVCWPFVFVKAMIPLSAW